MHAERNDICIVRALYNFLSTGGIFYLPLGPLREHFWCVFSNMGAEFLKCKAVVLYGYFYMNFRNINVNMCPHIN